MDGGDGVRGGLRVALAALGLAALVGCATAPAPVRAPGEAAAWLGEAPRVVVRIDPQRAAGLAQLLPSGASWKALADRTRAVWAGFDIDNLDDRPQAARTLRLVLEGNFPRGAVAWALDWNPDWKRRSTPPPVWDLKAAPLAVSLPEEGLVVGGRRLVTAPNPGVLRDLEARSVEAAAVWVSFWNPGRALFGGPGEKILPVKRLDVVLDDHEGVLEGPVILTFHDELAARAASVLLKVFAPQIRSRLGQDLDWEVSGSRITGTTLRLTPGALKALAAQFTTPQEVQP